MSSNPSFLSLISTITRAKVDEHLPVRCPDASASERMAEKIAKYRDAHDSIGGTVVSVSPVPAIQLSILPKSVMLTPNVLRPV